MNPADDLVESDFMERWGFVTFIARGLTLAAAAQTQENLDVALIFDVEDLTLFDDPPAGG